MLTLRGTNIYVINLFKIMCIRSQIYLYMFHLISESWWMTFPSELCSIGKPLVFLSLQANPWGFTLPFGMETLGQQDGGQWSLICQMLHSLQASNISMLMLALQRKVVQVARGSIVAYLEILIKKARKKCERSNQNG